jgi:RNA polymerase sigma factor (sigma-70 family)
MRRLVAQRGDEGVSDAHLLHRFAVHRDEAAFEVLLWRHGPMVLGVGQRLLGNLHDAEDVLQATFLALVRQAPTIGRREALGAWLHKVAYRTALRARSQRHQRKTKPLTDAPAFESSISGSEHEALVLLDEELQRLPAKYRTPLVLSYLQGLSNREIAAELGCPIGTVFTRLARGRDMIRKRLQRRGITITAAALTAALAESAPAATLSTELVRSTVQAALAFAAGSGAAAVSPQVAALTEGVLKMMWLGKVKLIAAVLALAAIAGSGAGLLTFRASARDQEERKAQATAEEKSAEATNKPAREALRYDGKDFEDWRRLLLTELKPQRRVDGIKALSAFGTNGYAREAAAAVLEVLRAYDPPRHEAGTASQVEMAGQEALVIEAAHVCLTKIGKDATPALVEELRIGNKRSRYQVLDLLRRLVVDLRMDVDPKPVIPAVLKVVQDNDPTIRNLALWALATLDKDGTHASVIVQATKDKESSVRMTAIGILGEYGSKNPDAALPPLLAAAKQKDNWEIQECALRGLREFKPDPAVVLPIVQEALNTDNENVRHAAIGVVGRLGPDAKHFVGKLIELLKKWDNNAEQLAIVQALGEIGPAAKEAVPALIRVREEVEKVRGGGPLYGAINKALEKIQK